MTATAVSPSIAGSPPAETSPSSLFGSVHDHTHTVSDWDHFDASAAGEDEELHQLMQDMVKDLFEGGVYESDRPKWTFETSGKDVKISFDESEEKVWTIAQAEIEAYRA